MRRARRARPSPPRCSTRCWPRARASPLDFDARLKALSAFLELPEAGSLTAANKRIANILRKANDAAPRARSTCESCARHAEVRLYDSMRALRDAVAAATAQREYAGALWAGWRSCGPRSMRSSTR